MLPLMRDKAWCQRLNEAHSIRRRVVGVTDTGKQMNGAYLLRNIATKDGSVLGGLAQYLEFARISRGVLLWSSLL